MRIARRLVSGSKSSMRFSTAADDPRVRTCYWQQPSPRTGRKSVTGLIPAVATETKTLYSSTVHHLSPRSRSQKKSFLWWQHSFYRLRWKQWHEKWLELADRTPASRQKGPAGVLRSLQRAECDPDVALRLAFLVASEKPPGRSELAGDNKRHQRIKRKLGQARDHLSKAACGLMEAALPEIAILNKKLARRRLTQSQSHILNAGVELKFVLSEIHPIFIKSEDVDSLKGLADVTNPQNGALWMRLQNLAAMCDNEIETLLWPPTIELPSQHELFTMVSYFKACSGDSLPKLITDLLVVAHEVYELVQPGLTQPLTQDATENRIKRFRKLKVEPEQDSTLPKWIEESTAQRAESGQLRSELLAYYPDQALPQPRRYPPPPPIRSEKF